MCCRIWLDALSTNVDRTARNPNLLWWHRALWLIDHGASLYWHHGPAAPDPRGPFEPIVDHVLLSYAASVMEADERLAPLVTEEALHRVVAEVPSVWLDGHDPRMYVEYLAGRLEPPRAFAVGAERARG